MNLRTDRVLLVVGAVLLLAVSTAYAQCATGRYGGDCSCTSNLERLGNGLTTILTCSEGTWYSTGPVSITDRTDMMYDKLEVPENPVGNALTIYPTGNLTLHVREFPNGAVRNGFLNTTGTFAVYNGTVHLIFDSLEQGAWSIQFAQYERLEGNPRLGVSSNATQFTCRTQTAPVGTVFLEFEARFNNTVANTASKCGFNKGSRNWAMWIYIAIASLAFLLIIFTIVTCVVRPLRKAIWYPPQ